MGLISKFRARQRRWRLSTILVACTALLVVQSAVASDTISVRGSGLTSDSVFVVVNAHATGPATGSDFERSAPATGFVRVSGSEFGDGLTGTVTCIASLGGTATNAVVSGVLDEPFVQDGNVYYNFSLLVVQGGDGVPQWIHFFPNNLNGLGACGLSLFFAAGVPELPGDVVSRGHFTLR